MPRKEQDTNKQEKTQSVKIPHENILRIGEKRVLMQDAAHITVEGNGNYTQPFARRIYQREHKSDIYKGRNASIIFLNPGHGQPLFDTGIIDEQNIFKIVDAKTGKHSVVAAIPVGQLLEMAVWMTTHNYAVPFDLQDRGKTWYGFLANTILNELGQRSIQNQVDLIKRKLRPEVIQRKLKDKRRTSASIIQEALRTYYSTQMRNRLLIQASKDFFDELRELKKQQPNVVNFDEDQYFVDMLEARIITMEQDLRETLLPPLPPTESPNPS